MKIYCLVYNLIIFKILIIIWSKYASILINSLILLNNVFQYKSLFSNDLNKFYRLIL